MVLLIPLMAMPIALLITNRNRLITTLLWLLLSVGSVMVGISFSHFSADLPTFEYSTSYLIWFGVVATLTVGVSASVGPQKAFEALTTAFNNISKGAGRLVIWFVLLMALMQFMVVILRYVFGVNFIAMQESITYMHGAVFLIAAGYALLTDDHVRVDIFYRDAPPRHKALVNFIGTYIFLFPFCLLLLWTASPYVAQAWLVQEGSTEQSGIQGVYLLKTLIPIFAVLLAMAGFVNVAHAIETLQKEVR